MFSFKIKPFFWLLALIAISAITHWRWLILPNFFTSGDFWFANNQFFLDALGLPSLLDFAATIGLGTTTLPSTPLLTLGGIVIQQHLNFAMWERIFFLWPIALLAPIPIFLFLQRTIRSNSSAFLGSLVYVCNTYILARETTHLHIAIVYLLAPLVLFFFEDILLKKSRHAIFGFLITYTICSIYDVRIVFILSFILLAYGVYLLLFRLAKPSWKLVGILVVVGIALLLIESYWFMPFVFSQSSLGYGRLINRGLFPSFATLSHAISLSEPFWTGKNLSDFIAMPALRWNFALPLFAILWMLFKKTPLRKSYLLFWTVIGLIGMFLVKQANDPFPSVYQWLFIHVPGFSLFRESSKFNIISAMGLSILVTASHYILKKRYKSLSISLGGILALIMLMNIIPFVNGSIGSLTIPRNIPKQYESITSFFDKDTTYGRSLWVPSADRFIPLSADHPRISISDMFSTSWFNFTKDQETPLSLLSEPYAKALLNFGSFTTIGAPYDTINDIYRWTGKPQEYFDVMIAKIPDLTPSMLSSSTMRIWNNPNAKPHAYIANNVITVDGPVTDFSGNDPSTDTAFVFKPDISTEIFSRIKDTIATNQEMIPFALTNIVVNNDSISTTSEITNTAGLTSTTIPNTTSRTASLYARKASDSITIIARIPQKEEVQITSITSGPGAYALDINGATTLFVIPEESPEDVYIGIARLFPTQNSITIFNQTSNATLIPNGSFEQGAWGPIGDCNNVGGTPVEENGISENISDKASEGLHGLELSAQKHVACLSSPIIAPEHADHIIGSLDYQYQQGSSGFADIISPTSSPSTLQSIRFAPIPDWQHKIFSIPNPNKQDLSLFLYQPSKATSNQPSSGIFDNVSLHAYTKITSEIFTVPANLFTEETRAFTNDDLIIPAVDSYTKHLASFDLGDCNNIDHTSLQKNGIFAQITSSSDDFSAISLRAKRHIACLAYDVPVSDPAFDYIAEITYKTIKGATPQLSLASSDSSTILRENVPPSKSWNTYQVLFSGKDIGQNGVLRVALDATATPAETLIRSLVLKKVPILPREYITSHNSYLPNIPTVFKKINQSTYEMSINDLGLVPRMLVLSDSYDSGWRLFARKAGSNTLSFSDRITWKTPGIALSSAHFTANAFTNGWIIDPEEIQQKIGTTKNIEIVMEYWPQRLVNIGTVISLTTLSLCVLIYISSILWRYTRK